MMSSVNEGVPAKKNKSFRLGAECNKIVQNDVPYANSVVNTIIEK